MPWLESNLSAGRFRLGDETETTTTTEPTPDESRGDMTKIVVRGRWQWPEGAINRRPAGSEADIGRLPQLLVHLEASTMT